MNRLDYWRERTQLLRIAKGLEPTRDFVHAERFVKIGKEMRKMEHLPTLPWPKDLYSRPLTIETLMMQAPKTDDICAWEGCNQPHRNNHPMTIPSHYGHGFSVKYFCVDAHKSAHVKKYGRT